MSGFLRSLSQLYRSQLERHRNRSFLRAAMAACALVSMANGVVSFRQRIRIDRLLETLETLRVFDPHEGVELFNELVASMNESPRLGHENALESIKKEVAGAPDKAQLLVRICLAVSEHDGEIPLAEQVEIVGLCTSLGVDPGACGLYTDDTGPDNAPG